MYKLPQVVSKQESFDDLSNILEGQDSAGSSLKSLQAQSQSGEARGPRRAPPADGQVSAEELRLHCHKADAWTAVRGVVYDITDFISKHPGGQTALIKILGQDGTRFFGERS
jgi:cytochrome b involved in lipid metabolism